MAKISFKQFQGAQDAKHMCSDKDYKSLSDVKKEYPSATKSATKIVKVTGGWMVFDYANDYDIWKNQK